MRMTMPTHLPTFIIGGAPRSGTTYLAEALDRHPEVCMAKPFIPEPKVFMGERQPLEVYHNRYRALFANAGNKPARGEKTSYYLECALARELILQVAPQARILFIVREPVARAYSNYLQTKKNGLEHLSFEEAIDLEGRRPSPLPPDKYYARPFDYLSRGDYAALALPYFEAFGPGQVRFLIHEDITRRPRQLWKEIQPFLGLSEVPFEKLDVGVVNSAKEVGPAICPKTEQRLRERMLPLVRRFAGLTGLDIEPWGYAI
jgi:hypothetical protein